MQKPPGPSIPPDEGEPANDAVRDENAEIATRNMPGRRAGLPPGALPGPPPDPQQDEHRNPPTAPAPRAGAP